MIIYTGVKGSDKSLWLSWRESQTLPSAQSCMCVTRHVLLKLSNGIFMGLLLLIQTTLEKKNSQNLLDTFGSYYRQFFTRAKSIAFSYSFPPKKLKLMDLSDYYFASSWFVIHEQSRKYKKNKTEKSVLSGPSKFKKHEKDNWDGN